MNFPRRKEATNKELILTIIEIQGYLSRYGKSHTNWHETLNEVIERLEQTDRKRGINMLHEEVKKYRELLGDTNPNTPISRIGGYLDGYEKALEQEPVCDRLAREYISKVKCCDECFLSTFCTINDLRESREPKYYCIENIKNYFVSKSEGKE